jgi:hypothetical protein
MKLSERFSLDQNITTISFKDKSGSLRFTKNVFEIHYVYILDHEGRACFAGYVGLIHVPGLKQEVELIQTELGV